jgi:hypothetical protein
MATRLDDQVRYAADRADCDAVDYNYGPVTLPKPLRSVFCAENEPILAVRKGKDGSAVGKFGPDDLASAGRGQILAPNSQKLALSCHAPSARLVVLR